MDILRSLNSQYAEKIESLQMTTSAFTVSLGIDNADILIKAGLPCGYGLLTLGNDVILALSGIENNEFRFSEKCFYIGINCRRRPSVINPFFHHAAPLP